MSNYVQGDNFVRERTGSATMVNLDGKQEHDFTDGQAALNGKLKKTAKIDRKNIKLNKKG